MFCVDVGRTEAHVLLLATVSLLLVSLMFRGFYSLPQVTIQALVPARVAVDEEVVFAITLRNESTTAYRNLRLEPPRLGRRGHWIELPSTVAHLEAGASLEVQVRARFHRRGEHSFESLTVAALVPWSLAQGPGVRTLPLRILVVPKLARVMQVDLHSRAAGFEGTTHYGPRRGDAMDLLGVRPYRPGDLPRDLHARSWARLGFPVVREYQTEQARRMAVVVDTDTAGTTPLTFEMALSLTAGLIAKLCSDGSSVDLILLGQPQHAARWRANQASVNNALDALALATPGPAFSLHEVLVRTAPLVDGLSALFVVLLGSNGGRELLGAALGDRKVNFRTYLISDSPNNLPAHRIISPAHVARGEALAL